jgi:myo-inositol 2-dehydrogenase/D-chiro-inositol 1-dehydrogenase
MSTANDRRKLLSTGAAATFTIIAPHLVKGSQANSALSVGLIGCGNRGMYVSRFFARNEYAKVTALCDLYEDRLAVGEKEYAGAPKFKAYQDLLASNVDAVYIATPIIFHPEHFEGAVKARKHIFMEKAAAVDVKGCQRILAAARKADPTKRISMDFQQRYGAEYRHCHQLVTAGELGALKMIRAAWLGTGAPIKQGHPPGEEKIRNWFFYKEMSGDMLIEQNCHNVDVIHWFTGMKPAKACGYGSRQRTDIGDILDNLAFTLQYANGLVVSFSANQFGRVTGWSEVGETFICERGTIRVSRQGYQLYREGQPVEEVKTTHDITKDAVDQFIEGARTGQMENAAIWGAESTLMAILAREAIYSGKEMTWDRLLKG